MRIKIMVSALVAILGVSLFMSPDSYKASAQTKEESQKTLSIEEAATMIEFYDENGERFYPFTDEELIAFQKQPEVSVFSSSYSFGSTTFSNTILVAGGRTFRDIGSVALNVASGTKAVPISVEAYDNSNNLKGKTSVPGGWQGGLNIPIAGLTKGQSHYLQLRNETVRETARFSSGYVFYNIP